MNKLPQKALSIRQPWAWLVVNGIRDVDNRDWETKYRGPILIHAGKKIDGDAYDWVEWRFGRGSIAIPPPDQLDCGGIVGVTSIIDCTYFSESPWLVKSAWGYILKDSRPLPFMACKGRPGFFKVDRHPGYYRSGW